MLMSSWVDYKGLQLPSPDPSGDAGNNIKQNFVILADRGIADDASLGSVAFVGGTISEPTLDEDNDNFFWDNTNKRLGIGNKTPITVLDVSGPITVGTPSSSVPTPPSGKAVLFVNNNSGTLELKIKFSNGTEAVIVNDD
jgi:hypothetical protein